MPELRGQAFIWGVPGVGYDSTGVASAVLNNDVETETATIASIAIFQDLDYARESDTEDLMDKNGDTIGRAYFNKRQTARVTVVPFHATATATAATNAALLLPTPGSRVTSFEDTDLTKISGDWLVNRASTSRTNRSIMAVELELEQFDDNDVTTTIT